MMIGPAGTMDPFDTDPTTVALWRERERRQRTIRVLMMFLLMLLLMDGEEPHPRLRQRQKDESSRLEPAVFASRVAEDERVRVLAEQHPRYQRLVEANHRVDVEHEIIEWALSEADRVEDEFAPRLGGIEPVVGDPSAERLVRHYPWNASGFYRGEWVKAGSSSNSNGSEDKEDETTTEIAREAKELKRLTAVELESTLPQLLVDRHETMAVVVLPEGLEIAMRDDHNYTFTGYEQATVDLGNRVFAPVEKPDSTSITLTHDAGRAAFQLFARSVPAMRELSLVDGFVKLYDSNTPGYSTRKDILLRVRGVMIHAIGRLSLVSNVNATRSAFVMEPEQRKRRLLEALANVTATSEIEEIRDEVVALYAEEADQQPGTLLFESPGFSDKEGTDNKETVDDPIDTNGTDSIPNGTAMGAASTSRKMTEQPEDQPATSDVPPWSDLVMPYPYVRDDKDESIRKVRSLGARRMPPREQLLEANAASCEFEINMDVEDIEWTVGAWRALLTRRFKELKRYDPSLQPDETADKVPVRNRPLNKPRARAKALQDQALVMSMMGTIHSENCNFHAALNATAMRTDWDATTSKAINYSFYMMLVCLTQILILLRQLLHSQTQSVASRVSLLCIGWQTIIDALICLAHIYFSLAMQPLFTAFASVAFFKLLIFCVIEMKYMAMIIQARNSRDGGQPTDVLRRQIAMLHLRFFVFLLAAFLLLFYVGEKYRIVYVLTLYSFWVPQIVLNAVTEARAPMHKYYIYGMSLSRLVAPVYMFAVPNNFLKEVYPDSPTDYYLVEMLVVWVAMQTAMLVAQSKYGARFFVPARFLPPKFDYSRPLPASMLPPTALAEVPSAESMEDRPRVPLLEPTTPALVAESSSAPGLTPRGRHTTAPTTRNRMRGGRLKHASSSMTTEAVVEEKVAPPPTSTIDCSICYDPIDIRNRAGYMLAPCEHLFHRQCLSQWMDVKMECPICRTELPAL